MSQEAPSCGRSLLVVSVSIAGVISLLGILPLDAAGPAAWGEEVRIVRIVKIVKIVKIVRKVRISERSVRMVRKVKIVRKVGKVRR